MRRHVAVGRDFGTEMQTISGSWRTRRDSNSRPLPSEGHTSLGQMSRDHEAETPFYLYATVSACLRAEFRSFPFGVYRAHFLQKTN